MVASKGTLTPILSGGDDHSSITTQFCRQGFHEATDLLVDGVHEEDRVYRCARCHAEWSPHVEEDDDTDWSMFGLAS